MSHHENEAPTQYVSAVGTPAGEHAALLVVERSRLVLDVLSERMAPLKLGELAAEITAQEKGLDAPPEEAPTDVTIDLHHIRLPKLDEAGVLDYNPESRVVKPIEGANRMGETDPITWSTDGANAALRIHLQEHVIEYFDDSAGETASIDELARYMATRVSDTAELPAERIQLHLHHAVLPRMADAGIIDYDPRTTTVRCRTNSS